MKKIKYPLFFGGVILFMSALMIGIFIGKRSAGNTMYVVAESTIPSIITESTEVAIQPSTENTSGKDTTGERLNINTATVEELAKLPEIGGVIAQRIVDYRLENGLFVSIEEIMEVSGIGEKTFEKIKDHIVVR